MTPLTRRSFLAASAGAAVAGAAPPPARPRVAAIYTVFRHRSHAQNILENFLQPYLFNGKIVEPGMDVVSFYADQRAPEGDRTDEVARKYGVRLDDGTTADQLVRSCSRRCRAPRQHHRSR